MTGSFAKIVSDQSLLLDQEEDDHERTKDVLFDLSYGAISPSAARQYLTELDAESDDEEEDESTEEIH